MLCRWVGLPAGRRLDDRWKGLAQVEVRLEDWLVAQLLGDCVAMLDWQLQRQLTGLAKRIWCYLSGRGPDFLPGRWPGDEVLIVPLSTDVYAGWSLQSARECNNRARVTTAVARIVESDPRYVRITVEPRPESNGYQLRAIRVHDAARLADEPDAQGRLELVSGP